MKEVFFEIVLVSCEIGSLCKSFFLFLVSVIPQAVQTPFRSYLQDMLALVRTKTVLSIL